jgi:hypothetical protein
MEGMKRLLACLLLAAAALWQAPASAQARVYNQAELDALLAPVALYPDSLLANILTAATYPDDVHDAAAWLRQNAQLTPREAVRAAEGLVWHPSVKALIAFPELLARMDESAQWTADLGAAFLNQEPHVMDTVQGLRRRAQASGADLPAQPAQPQLVHAPWYNPMVVYGSWWWPAYRPVYWRPWHPRPPVFVSTSFFVTKHHHGHHRPHHRHSKPAHVHSKPAHVTTIHNHARQVQPIVSSVRLPQRELQHHAPRQHQHQHRGGQHRGGQRR